ncbi:hypothetical protein IEQ44_05875 [Nocardioides sp. Y6]|uniref:DUF4352 domain-containing protein n=1 Tax=Nocardioides malaquae TaxID=2773426 RepID=A0ABR9RRI9_9ACTN|nr:hypothetical protein [Nocardioides malaquae]MBE7324174.1 hypothetical protein [Nocardioides malaquae]
MVDLRTLLDDASLEDGPPADPLDLVLAGRRRVRRRGLARGAAALALVLVVSATALAFRPGATDPARDPEPAAPSSPTPTPEPSETAEVDETLTPPGTQLRLGGIATVPVKHIRTGRIEITVTAVRRGDRADLLALPDLDPRLRSDASSGDFWYVDAEVTHVSGKIGGYYVHPDVEPVVRGGKRANSWVMGPDFSPCPLGSLSRPPATGESVETCFVYRTEPGSEVVGLRWGPFESDYDITQGDPVTWRQ